MMNKTIYTPHTGDSFEYNKINACPFCGDIPDIIFIGNDYTKSVEVKIRCKCGALMHNAVLNKYHNAEWIAKITIDKWNKRANNKL